MSRPFRRTKGRHRARSRRRLVAALRVGAIVAMLVGAGLLGMVAWELWGTGMSTARAQSALRAQLADDSSTSRPIPGSAAGLLEIPRLGLDVAFLHGVDLKDLARGPGHYPGTPLPGGGGNVVMAGHRTTHGAPFWGLATLEAGDEITVRTGTGRFVYRVQWVRVVAPDDWSIVRRTDRPSLTLTTCNPWFSARERLAVRALQVYGRTPGGFLGGADSPVGPLV